MSGDELQSKPELFLDLIRRQQRGRLKIYLGFAAGVGKTFDMLQEGNRLRRQGVDVAIGFVETHGRAETAAQIGDLEQVPRRRIEYRGIVLEEMDVDAVIARRPTIALVDELAHTNAPGSRNPKRYQDVEEILRAGSNVITTLNIQHLESLHDIVQRATGVRVKERIPDYVVAMADQIVNVDLSAEDLRDRLQAGKIYPPERIQTAMENFFAPDKLTQLRELAMEEIAFRLDSHRREKEQRSGERASGSERVMACLSSQSPHAASLLRKAARIADRLGIPGTPCTCKPRARPLNTSMPPPSAKSATIWNLPGSWAAPHWLSRAPILSAPSTPLPRNTALPTSSLAAAASLGIAAGSDDQYSITSCKPSRAWT